MRKCEVFNFRCINPTVFFFIVMVLLACEAQRNKTKQLREGSTLGNIANDDALQDSLSSSRSSPTSFINRLMPIASFYDSLEQKESYYFPQIELGVLFNDFCHAKSDEEVKFFANAIPQKPIQEILNAYASAKRESEFDIEAFVAQNFEFPQSYQGQFISSTENSIEKHIEMMWKKMIKEDTFFESEKNAKNNLGSQLPLPNEYLFSGEKSTEMRYWDSYFIVLGLMASNQKELAIKVLNNCKYLIGRHGYIPLGTRSYYLGQSHPPVFSLMIDAVFGKDYTQMTPYIESLILENDFWMRTTLPKATQGFLSNQRVMQFRTSRVNRYFSDIPMPRTANYNSDLEIFFSKNKLSNTYTMEQLSLFTQLRSISESGWGFSSRWLADPKDKTSFDIIHLVPTDLNCLLYLQEDLLYRYFRFKKNKEKENKYFMLSENRGKIIAQYNWNVDKKFYTDYNLNTGKPKDHLNLSGVFPLICKIANIEQAKYIAKRLEKDFLKPGGLMTSIEQSGESWDAPYGVAPLQYFAIWGLKNYGYIHLAKKIKQAWMQQIAHIYKKNGKIFNRYNVLNNEFEYENQDSIQEGFGWTNSLYIHLLKKEPLLK